MATYKGQITLVDMSEIAEVGMLYTWIMYSDDPYADNPIITTDPTDKKYIGISYNQKHKEPSNNPQDYNWTLFKGENGTKITSVKNYYAISTNGVVPPIDRANFQIIDGNLYLSENGELSLVVNENLMQAIDSQSNILAFVLENEFLMGVGLEWLEDIPETPKGYFLWTKSITQYSDNSRTVQFLSSYQGQDGEKGQDASKFKFRFNQNEILKFIKKVDVGVNTSISPGNLIISVVEDDIHTEGQFKQVKDLDINKFSVELYDISDGNWVTIDNSLSITDEPFITVDSTDNFNINLNSLIAQGTYSESKALKTLVEEECILKFAYSHQVIDALGTIYTYNIVDFLNVRYGMNRDMATLQLGAKDIVASVQNSKLTFSAEGLSITNGGFKIINNNNEEVLTCDDNGNVVMRGQLEAATGTFAGELQAASGTFAGELTAATGSFSGHIEAESGSFKGKIEAESGTIGGFHIDQTHLASTKTDTINGISGISKLYLDGEEGYIEAADIRLTGTMTINDSIVLKKPKNSGDSFIRVSGNEADLLLLKADGSIQVGNNDNAIIINGAEGSIMSKSYENGLGWKITNGRSVFNDVTVKGSIRASVLEYGEVQAIGGELLVRPSTRIISSEIVEMALVDEGETSTDNNYVKVYVEEVAGFNKGDMCRFDYQSATEIAHQYCTVQSVSQISDEEKWIILKSIDSPIIMDLSGKPLVSFGQNKDNIGISINGSVSNAFSVPQSLSVFEFDYINKKAIPRIILGKLPEGENYGRVAGTYGLYAENVLLKGSLVTTFSNSTGEISSGINTLLDGPNSPNAANTEAAMNFEDPGEILLWAGANGTDAKAIEGSKFFVDKNGNLFAGSGYFKGTIISDATITASVIETVTIRGKNQDENIIEYGPGEFGDSGSNDAVTGGNTASLAKPALTIEDATRGIHFTALEDNLLSDSWSDWSIREDGKKKFLRTKEGIEVKSGQEYSLNFRIKVKEVNIYFYDEDEGLMTNKTISKSMQDFIYFTPPSDAKKVEIEFYRYSSENEYRANLAKLKPFLGKYKVVFQVNKDSIIANVAEFVLNGDLKIRENGSMLVPNLYVTDNKSRDAIIVGKKEISYADDFNNADLTTSGAKGSINFDSDGLAFSTNSQGSILDLSGTNINVNGTLRINETVYYGGRIKYQPAYSGGSLVGYDLYVE